MTSARLALFGFAVSMCTPNAPSREATSSTADAAPAFVVVTQREAAAERDAATVPEASVLDVLGESLGPPRALAERFAREANAIPAGELHISPPHDADRDREIAKKFGARCHLERTCGSLWGIDCEAAVDGPYYYVRPQPDGFHEITTCGGACMGGRCTNCPPKNEGWTCATY